MPLLNITAIAVALAMDAFAVAVATGIQLGRIDFRQNFRLAWHFGLFQALMPIIGWAAGRTIRSQIEHFDHWVAFALLLFVSQGMLRQAFAKEGAEASAKDPTRGATMVMLSLATSMDALAVGLSISILNVSIWLPAAVIGVVAAGFTTLGMHLGTRVSRATRLGRYADLLGGLVLLAIGLNLLREHGVFG